MYNNSVNVFGEVGIVGKYRVRDSVSILGVGESVNVLGVRNRGQG